MATNCTWLYFIIIVFMLKNVQFENKLQLLLLGSWWRKNVTLWQRKCVDSQQCCHDVVKLRYDVTKLQPPCNVKIVMLHLRKKVTLYPRKCVDSQQRHYDVVQVRLNVTKSQPLCKIFFIKFNKLLNLNQWDRTNMAQLCNAYGRHFCSTWLDWFHITYCIPLFI